MVVLKPVSCMIGRLLVREASGYQIIKKGLGDPSVYKTATRIEAILKRSRV